MSESEKKSSTVEPQEPATQERDQEADKPNVKLLGILCNWCSYAGADLAGTSRFQYSPAIHIVRIMCSGRIDPALIYKAFKSGVDGILIGGCHFGDCHYIHGNYHAVHKIGLAQRWLKHAGIEPERLRLEWISAAEGQRFAQVVNEFNETIQSLGHLELTEDMEQRLDELIEVTEDFRVRWLVGKEVQITEKGNVYGNTMSGEEYDNFLDHYFGIELTRHRILKEIEKEAKSAKEIANTIGEEPKVIMEHLFSMLGQHQVAIEMEHHDAKWIKEMI
ncbi:MAG: hydrogenase iron-sulfur subunit [Promethearchaeota archaeon]